MARVTSKRDRQNGAFYTPARVARRMVRCLPAERPATILDPACGKGDLLRAAADRFGIEGIRYIGVDRNPEVLEVCRDTLESKSADNRLICTDFFEYDLSRLSRNNTNLYVIMNPPFKGYGLITSGKRRQLLGAVPGLRGRYNLAHAFLVRTLTDLRPKSLVALLPGTWPRASYNHLKHLLKVPRNSWRALPESTFDGATTTSGFIVLRQPHGRVPDRHESRPKSETKVLKIKQGVATGADALFIRLAGSHPRSGRVVNAARGRDVSGSLQHLPAIWIPPGRETKALGRITASLTKAEMEQLANRFCVKRMGGSLWSFHESYPRWFLGESKLILPEVCTRVSALLDLNGRVLPLHSTIAIRVTSRENARKVSAFLLSKRTWSRLKARCPRMVNGAIRLTVPHLRALLGERDGKDSRDD